MNPSVIGLCRVLKHTFGTPVLLEEALTHRSAIGHSNERLEFLGDAILNFVIAERLFNDYPQASEGELSRLRATLVKGETLAEIARQIGLGDYLRLGPGELKSGGNRRSSILANALEAVFGAVYLDSDFVICRHLILRLYEGCLANLPTANELKDPKTRLQEYLQARGLALPVYRILEISGEAHAQQFTVECSAGTHHTVAVGDSRRKAEQEAARQLLALIVI
ncbi:MAG: ribonuclease III [Gammaproteobacteria bacterium]|nr:ribonuclease III [Gammaproteobacteria bacterium]MCP5424370.1 ribonuclease III [Gammaproteobacteria bacterium]